MKLGQQLKELIGTLPRKQRTLDFGDISPWTELPTADRQACRDALAVLLFQVVTTPLHDERRLEDKDKENDEHER
jgi:hypothetical protein